MNCRKCGCLILETDLRCPMCNAKQRALREKKIKASKTRKNITIQRALREKKIKANETSETKNTKNKKAMGNDSFRPLDIALVVLLAIIVLGIGFTMSHPQFTVIFMLSASLIIYLFL